MKWKGKLIGLLVGVLTRRPAFMVLGLLLGHLYDIGLFSNRAGAPSADTDADAAAGPGTAADDPYTVLGIRESASDDDVEQAYRRRMSEYHPDRVANAASEIRELAGQRAREINGAYERIKQLRGL